MRLHCSELGGRSVTVKLNGEDVTTSCIEFDTDGRWVHVYKRNSDGQAYIAENGIECATTYKYGVVEASVGKRWP